MRHQKLLILGALAIAASTPITACGSSSLAGGGSAQRAGSSHGGAITLYSGQHEQTTAQLVRAFERESATKVNVRSADEATLGNQILQEAQNTPADVFLAENTPVLEKLREQGALARVAPATLRAVPSRYSSAQGEWVGVSARVSALVYNTAKVAPGQLPSSILELAEPKWKGKVGFAPSETDFQPLITAIVRRDGAAAAERWLTGLQANGRIYPDNETVVAQVNNGESAVGPINHYYWYRLRSEIGAGAVHSALRYYAADDPGNLIDISGAAVLRSSSHQAAAQAFLAFLVSRSGQETLARSYSYEYPLRRGVSPAARLRPLADLHPTPLTPAELGDGGAALALEQKLGLL